MSRMKLPHSRPLNRAQVLVILLPYGQNMVSDVGLVKKHASRYEPFTRAI